MIKKTYPEEYPVSLVVNGQEIAIFQLTKSDLVDWAVGYLFAEGMIQSITEIKSINVDEYMGTVQVQIDENFNIYEFLKKQRHFTAGCGRGMTFFSMSDVKELKKIPINKAVQLSYLLKKRHEFAQSSPLYLQTGGMHGACIVNGKGEIFVREDIGRHNAVDKIIGYALRKEMNPDELILLTTGRISYEMLSKAARFGFGIIGTRTAATKQAIQLANYLNIDVVGYLRGKMVNVYTSNGRILDDVTKKVSGS